LATGYRRRWYPVFFKYMNRFFLNSFIFSFLLLVACSEDGGTQQQPQTDHEGEFRNPILTSAPDPWVFQKDDWYYITHTTGSSIRLYRSKKMSDLSAADVKTVWSPPSSGLNSKNIWAPELHFVDGKWYFYYAADDGTNANHRIWVLENSSPDPFQGTWVDKGELELPDDKWAIDGSIFEHQGQLYFVWSGWEGDIDVRQDLFIVKMQDPLTAEGDRVTLSVPEHDWEKNGGPPSVNEGPQFIQHEGKVFISYSASGCWTDDYALGLLTADANANLLDVASWTKSAEPIFETNSSGQAFGPGHNSFFKSPDGKEDWIIYHANSSAGQGCGSHRSFRIQKMSWSEDGRPILGVPVPLSTYQKTPSGE
jgi:GH43 family beta-xylosidase